MAPSTTNAPAARDDREGLSPSPQPFGLADLGDDDDDDMEYEPASEQSEHTEETDADSESLYTGTWACHIAFLIAMLIWNRCTRQLQWCGNRVFHNW